MIKISEIEQVITDIFEEDKAQVNSVESVYESTKDKKFLKLVISIHGLRAEDVAIIHTKFIFKVNLGKTHLESNSFIYLYDINCVYQKVEFDSIIDMKKRIQDIVESNDFGEDIQTLSDFIEAPAMFLNFYMRKNKITDYSIFEVQYQPKFKTTPCSKTTFDFQININNNYKVDLSIKKEYNNEDETPNYYKFYFKFLGEVEEVETEDIKNIHMFIGSNLSRILDKNLKNK
jgi:hypothetical protein